MGEPQYATLPSGIVKDWTSSAELRERTELPNESGFLLALGDYSQLSVGTRYEPVEKISI